MREGWEYEVSAWWLVLLGVSSPVLRWMPVLLYGLVGAWLLHGLLLVAVTWSPGARSVVARWLRQMVGKGSGTGWRTLYHLLGVHSILAAILENVGVKEWTTIIHAAKVFVVLTGHPRVFPVGLRRTVLQIQAFRLANDQRSTFFEIVSELYASQICEEETAMALDNLGFDNDSERIRAILASLPNLVKRQPILATSAAYFAEQKRGLSGDLCSIIFKAGRRLHPSAMLAGLLDCLDDAEPLKTAEHFLTEGLVALIGVALDKNDHPTVAEDMWLLWLSFLPVQDAQMQQSLRLTHPDEPLPKAQDCQARLALLRDIGAATKLKNLSAHFDPRLYGDDEMRRLEELLILIRRPLPPSLADKLPTRASNRRITFELF